MLFKKPSLFSILAIAAAFSLVGCEAAPGTGSSANLPTEQNPITEPIVVAPGATPSASPVNNDLVQMQSNVKFNFTGSRLAKAQNAVTLMLRVLSSQAFRDRILGYVHNGMNQFYSTNDTNLQVYRTIIAGAENFNTAQNNTVDLNLNIYTPSVFNKWGTVGYTYANSDQIFTNVYYFDSYTAANLAGHWAHEWTHKLGYEHDFNSTSQRPYSVPYAVGDLVDELASKI